MFAPVDKSISTGIHVSQPVATTLHELSHCGNFRLNVLPLTMNRNILSFSEAKLET